MIWLVLILFTPPTSWSAPHLSIDSCKNQGCRVSDPSLNSALSTFLCYTEKQFKTMGEKEKKTKLAEKVVSHLLFEEGKNSFKMLTDMDTESLVRLANLILHNMHIKAQSGERKTPEQHRSKVIEGIVQKNKLNPLLFERANPHFLAFLSCKNQKRSIESVGSKQKSIQRGTSTEREGRGAFLSAFFNLKDQAGNTQNILN